MNLVTRMLLVLAMIAIPLYATAGELKTGTDAPRDINGAQVDKMRGVKGVRYNLADGMIVLTMPNDEWAPNHAAKGVEFLSEQRGARLGIDARVAGTGWSASQGVSEAVEAWKAAHGGTWTAPANVTVAGIPAVMVSGYDVFGNYHYEVYGVERLGIQYVVWLRTPYENRWSTSLNADVAWVLNNLHPSTRMVQTQLKEQRAK